MNEAHMFNVLSIICGIASAAFGALSATMFVKFKIMKLLEMKIKKML